MAEGIEKRVGKNGVTGYRASVWSATENKRIRRTFPTLAAARAWRQDAAQAVRNGRLRATPDHGPTVAEAAEAWLNGARAGQVRNRSGDPYKPSAIRAYEQNLRIRVLPEFGERRLGQIKRADLQRFVDELVASGCSAATVMTTLLPVRAIYRRALSRGEIQENPTRGLEMPAIRRAPKFIPSPAVAEALLSALDGEDRALFATAVYAGLRRGELTALRWADVDLARGVIRVERGWDKIEGEIAPKSREGRRSVPVPAPLRDVLVEHRMSTPERVRVFRSASWVNVAVKRARAKFLAAELTPVDLHTCRHTCASFLIAAGVNFKAVQGFLGHANISVTFDLYGHLLPGSEAEAATLLEAFLARSAGAAAVTTCNATEGMPSWH